MSRCGFKHRYILHNVFVHLLPWMCPVWYHAKRISCWGVRITVESACVSTDGRYWLESSQASLIDVSGALRLPLVHHVLTGRSYFKGMSRCCMRQRLGLLVFTKHYLKFITFWNIFCWCWEVACFFTIFVK